MQKIAMMGIGVLAILAPMAMAEESNTENAHRLVNQAQDMFVENGTAAFEQINGSDAFDPFVFVFGASDLMTVASSDFPELVGTGSFDPASAGHTHEGMLEHLEACDGLWVLHHFEPESGVVLKEILWLSEMGGYVFASGFFLPDLNLPEWLEAWYEEQLETMVRLLNTAAGCECT